MEQCSIKVHGDLRCDNIASHVAPVEEVFNNQCMETSKPFVCSGHKSELEIPDYECIRIK